MKKYYPLLSILLVNAILIIGVLCLGWNVGQIILVFIIESFWVGLFNLLKMAISRDNSTSNIFLKIFSRIFLMGFFCFHYFFFIFILSIFVQIMVIDDGHLPVTPLNFKLVNLMLFAGYSAHFITDYILPKKYLSTAPSNLFFAPYRRVWILAALIFAGGFISHSGMGSSYFYLIILVLAKLLADVVSQYLFKGFTYTKKELR